MSAFRRNSLRGVPSWELEELRAAKHKLEELRPRVLQLETAIMKARTALRPHRTDHGRELGIDDPELMPVCAVCYAAETLEAADK